MTGGREDGKTTGGDGKLSRRTWLLIWAFAILPFLGFWLYGLFDLDEGFYAAAAAEMNRRGEWLIPFYNGREWFEKPILMYWFAKPSLALFGDMIGPRLPSVLASLGTMWVVAWFCRRRISDQCAAFAVLVLAGSLLFVAAGRMMLTDPLLVLCLTIAFTTFWESLVGAPKWRLVTALALGFGVLAKGPVALLLFALLAVITYSREPVLRHKFKGYWLPGTLIVATVISLWYVPVYLARPEGFYEEFIIRQNIGRFLGGDEAHTIGRLEGLALYPAILFFGLLPWSIWLFRPLRDKAGVDLHGPLVRYLWSWALLIFIFFSISGAKLPHYILPAVPPLAMLAAYRWTERSAKAPPWKWAFAWVAFIFVFVNVGFWGWYHGWIPGAPSQAEVHKITTFVQKMGGDVAIYQMSRREKGRGTGELKLRETSLPSLLLYLDQTVLETDDLQRLAEAPKPLWVITRQSRISEEDKQKLEEEGVSVQEVNVADEQHYRLLRLE